ncbi:MAG: hypothetical protein V3T83_05150 [Acidobacteriota bacterium]
MTVYLDRESYQVDDVLIYSFVLRNRSAERLVVPWQPDWRIVEEGHESPPPGYAAASLGLTLEVGGTTAILFSQPIFGSQLAEGSLQAVKPGEEVRIMGRAKWASEIVSPLLDLSSDSRLTVQVGGLFQYQYPPDARFFYLPSRSAQSVLVRLQSAPE